MIKVLSLLALLLVIAVTSLQNLWFLTVLLSVYVTLKFGAAGLMVVAIGVDAYFGAFASVPYFSLIALVWYVVSELLRLRLRIIE